MRVTRDLWSRVLTVLLLVVGLAGNVRVWAQPADGWTGKRVVIRYGTVLQADEVAAEPAMQGKKPQPSARTSEPPEFFIYRVEQASDARVLLSAEGSSVRGWTSASRVILYDQAVEELTNQIRTTPGVSSLYLWRANVHAFRGEREQALADFTEVIRLDPGSVSAHIGRGLVWRSKGMYDRAIADLSEAIRLSPGSAGALVRRGNIRRSMREYDKGIADLSEAIRLDPDDAFARVCRGIAWWFKKNEEQAVADASEAIRLNPQLSLPHLARAMMRLADGRREVIADAQAAIAADAWKGAWPLYATVVGNLGARRAREDAVGRQLLEEAARKADRTVWPYPVIRYLRRELDEHALLAQATDIDRQTEARCYMGLDQRLQGRSREARANLRWVAEHGTPGFLEVALATAELDRMEPEPKRSPERTE